MNFGSHLCVLTCTVIFGPCIYLPSIFIYFQTGMTYKSDSDSSDSDSDDDDLARLREAVGCDRLKENLYSKPSCDSVKTNSDFESSKLLNVTCKVEDNPKSMSDSIKAIIEANSNKVKAPKLKVDAPSLRRDRQEDSKPVVLFTSELEVTPQFQKFVANKLDLLLDDNIEDIVDESKATKEIDDIGELRLLKRSKVIIKEVEESNIKRPRPQLLAHRAVGVSSEELSSCSVSGDFVLSKVEVVGWVNNFAGRVEEGVERIKKKKKKVKKKKKKDAAADENVSENKLLNEPKVVTS